MPAPLRRETRGRLSVVGGLCDITVVIKGGARDVCKQLKGVLSSMHFVFIFLAFSWSRSD